MNSFSTLTGKMRNVKLGLPLSGRRPVLLETRSSTWFITATVCVAIFTDIFLYAVIVPVFPFSLVTRIGVPESEVQHWLSILLAVYGAGLVVGAPISGIIADRTTYRKWPLLVGLVAVLGATIMLCLAKTLALLVLGRVLQGLSASVIWVVGLALLADTVKPEELATAMGYVGSSYSLAALVAPLLGGIVYDRSGYYAVFAMCFGVIILDVVLRLSMVEKKYAKKWLGGSETHEQQPQSSDSRADSVELTGPESVAQVRDKSSVDEKKTEQVEIRLTSWQKTQHKMPSILVLITDPRILVSFWATIVISSLSTGMDTTLTLFVNRTFGWDSLAAGVLFLALLLPSFAGPLFGKFVDKHGARWITTFGFLFMVPFLALLRLVTYNSIRQKVLLSALLALVGFGMACVLIAIMAEFCVACIAKEKTNPGMFGAGGAIAQTYSLFNISWALGSIVGAFWAGGIYNDAGWGTVTWTWALLAGISAIPVLLFTDDGWIGRSFGAGRRKRGSDAVHDS